MQAHKLSFCQTSRYSVPQEGLFVRVNVVEVEVGLVVAVRLSSLEDCTIDNSL